MSSPEIVIGRWGRILTGENIGWHVLVEDDSADTGGFLIFRSPTPSFDSCYDDWVETRRDLDRFFGFAGWRVDWSGAEDSQRR